MRMWRCAAAGARLLAGRPWGRPRSSFPAGGGPAACLVPPPLLGLTAAAASGPLQRPSKVKIKAQDLNGRKFTISLRRGARGTHRLAPAGTDSSCCAACTLRRVAPLLLLGCSHLVHCTAGWSKMQRLPNPQQKGGLPNGCRRSRARPCTPSPHPTHPKQQKRKKTNPSPPPLPRRLCSGFPARIFQHEYDHLDGRLFHDRMAPEVLASVRQQVSAAAARLPADSEVEVARQRSALWELVPGKPVPLALVCQHAAARRSHAFCTPLCPPLPLPVFSWWIWRMHTSRPTQEHRSSGSHERLLGWALPPRH